MLQVHLTPASLTSMSVGWATQNYTVSPKSDRLFRSVLRLFEKAALNIKHLSGTFRDLTWHKLKNTNLVQVAKGPLAPLSTAGTASLVQYGTSASALTSSATGITEVRGIRALASASENWSEILGQSSWTKREFRSADLQPDLQHHSKPSSWWRQCIQLHQSAAALGCDDQPHPRRDLFLPRGRRHDLFRSVQFHGLEGPR